MHNYLVLIWFTLREALSRKVFLFFIGLSVFVLLMISIIFMAVDTEAVLGAVQFSDDELIMEELLNVMRMMILSPIANLCLLLAIFSTSSFVPHMLEKGTIDLFLSKPVSRTQLIVGKYLGGVATVFINIVFIIIGIWLIIYFKFGSLNPSFLTSVFTITFTFAALYAVIVLFGVITKGSVAGMMMAYFIFLILSPILYQAKISASALIESEFWVAVIKGLYYIVPKTAELMGPVTADLASGKNVTDLQPILTTLLFILLTMFLTVILFRRKDF